LYFGKPYFKNNDQNNPSTVDEAKTEATERVLPQRRYCQEAPGDGIGLKKAGKYVYQSISVF
jgi:hypothetical protein